MVLRFIEAELMKVKELDTQAYTAAWDAFPRLVIGGQSSTSGEGPQILARYVAENYGTPTGTERNDQTRVILYLALGSEMGVLR